MRSAMIGTHNKVILQKKICGPNIFRLTWCFLQYAPVCICVYCTSISVSCFSFTSSKKFPPTFTLLKQNLLRVIHFHELQELPYSCLIVIARMVECNPC